MKGKTKSILTRQKGSMEDKELFVSVKKRVCLFGFTSKRGFEKRRMLSEES